MGLCNRFYTSTLNVMIAVESRDSSSIAVHALDFWVAWVLNNLGMLTDYCTIAVM